jgi:subtilisin family serine protease
MGVDFAATGEVLYAAYSPDSYYSSNEWLLVQGGDYKYGIQNAVSAAAPLTMGVIALMLEFRPELTPAELKTALQNSASKDNFTDSIANRTYGHGKLDAYRAVKEVEGLGIFNSQREKTTIHMYPNPASDLVNIDLSSLNLEGIREVAVTNAMGQKVFSMQHVEGSDQVQIDVGDYPNGIYYIVITGSSSLATGTLIKLTAP